MTDREKYSLEFKKLLQTRPYLLENSKKFIPLSEYLLHFVQKYDCGFSYIIPPSLYRLEVLDQFQKNIVYTTHLASPQVGQQLFTLVQVDPSTHLYFSFYFTENKFYVGVEIYSTDTKFILNFLDKYTEFEHSPEEKKISLNPAGFGGSQVSGGRI